MTVNPRIVRPLQTGWWEDVHLIKVGGGLRVRKQLHRFDALWARDVFVKEWRYLRDLPDPLRHLFPAVVGQCDELLADPPTTDGPLWFDMEYLDGFSDVRTMLAQGRIDDHDARGMQELLAGGLLHGLYRRPGEPFSADRIVWPVIEQVLEFAMWDNDLSPYARADALTINGALRRNLHHTVGAARTDAAIRVQLDNAPSVMLHGDLFYENVMYRPDPPSIRLIDPVSVAGVAGGPVVFDRAKFASWLSGELYALRHGRFELSADPAAGGPRVDYAWSTDDPVLRGLREIDLGGRLLSAMDEACGPSEEAKALLDAYFCLAMVPNTTMPQRLLRYARAVEHVSRWG